MARITLALLLVGVVGGSCGGQLIVPFTEQGKKCPDVPCTGDTVCQEGMCKSVGGDTGPCGQLWPNGYCANYNQVCVNGKCTTTPKEACSKTIPDGRCPGVLLCIDGECKVSLTPCSSTFQNGDCAPEELCVQGTCFPVPPACSSTYKDGYCPPETRPDGTIVYPICRNGACVVPDYTCSEFQPDGSCPSWQLCVRGVCIGPIPPDLCSSTYPTGRCNTGEVCVVGTCTPIGTGNECSAAMPHGLCPVGGACQDGVCVTIDVTNACSASNPVGLCPSGAICASGACTQSNCGNGGFVCGPSMWCSAGVCMPLPCDPWHPTGLCADSTLVCDTGVCLPPSCSITVPNGVCLPSDWICRDGVCYEPYCDATHPNNACPDPLDVCQNGVCVEGPCKLANTNGTCPVPGGPATVSTCNPSTGCAAYPMAPVCCDATLAGQTGCDMGSCAPPACSATNVHGACLANQYCVAGVCQPAPCTVFFPYGFCAGVDEVCVQGGCTKIHCNGQPPSYCAPKVCNAATDMCIQAPCDATHTDGWCPIKQTCCSAALITAGATCTLGVCTTPPCSAGFPGGACSGSDICAGGTCRTPPCSATYTTGDCGTNFTCQAGVCVKAPCSVSAPSGECVDVPTTWGIERCTGAGGCVPYECSPTFPTGPCAIGTICQGNAATCTALGLPTPCCATPACSGTYLGGACATGNLCIGGTCKPGPCSSLYPTGACAAGFTCLAGICQAADCSNAAPTGKCPDSVLNDATPRQLCAVNTTCASAPDNAACAGMAGCTWNGTNCVGTGNSTCIYYACSPLFPTATCFDCTKPCVTEPLKTCCTPDVSKVCTSGLCQTPTCGPSYPGGTCIDDPITHSQRACVAGVCQNLPCTLTNPFGACGSGQMCSSGVCVRLPCGVMPTVESLTGDCPPTSPVSLCVTGVCTPYLCGAAFPTAPCVNPLQICTAGSPPTCQTPACSGTYPSGSCAAPPVGSYTVDGTLYSPQQICSGSGGCITPGCSILEPQGQCSGNQQCCTAALVGPRACIEGTCTPRLCNQDASNPLIGSPPLRYYAGVCQSGYICCDDNYVTLGLAGCGNAQRGTCIPNTCSLANPTGICVGADAGKICANGTCMDGCSALHPTGVCNAGQACIGGICLATCPSDDDCDELSNATEGAPATDTDGDGVPDYLDRDSDNDGVPDLVEGRPPANCATLCAGNVKCNSNCTSPYDTDGDGIPDFRDVDSDNDYLGDGLEAGKVLSAPADTDGDGLPDFRDKDSDGDGILDRCEASDRAGVCAGTAPKTDTGVGAGTGIFTQVQAGCLTSVAKACDSDSDTVPDYLDLDSDADGVSDSIEARAIPANPTTFNSSGVDHDADGVPDYRDTDSDADGVDDLYEDVNGNGFVDCQVNGAGNPVVDARTSPACGATYLGVLYNYNPGCDTGTTVRNCTAGTSRATCDGRLGCTWSGTTCTAFGSKCLFAESSRVHPDTDLDTITDVNDGVFKVCATANLKPINVFYSQVADYALALEQSFNRSAKLYRGTSDAGLVFDDTVNANGSYAVAGFVLRRAPGTAANTITAATYPDAAERLKQKAIAQATADKASLATAATGMTMVFSRNFTSFDGYGVMVARYRLTAASTALSVMRDNLVKALDNGLTGYAASSGPATTDFTLQIETLYRCDPNTAVTCTPGVVMVVGALAPTGANSDAVQTYNYRSKCSSQLTSGPCGLRLGCTWVTTPSAKCVEDVNYQIPLFFADNVTSGSAITQYGDDMAALCQSLVQQASKLDTLWVIDDSGSMAPEITQVSIASKLFFALMTTSEADYRVAYATMDHSSTVFPPTYSFTDIAACSASSGTCPTTIGTGTNRLNPQNGGLGDGFTGAVAGKVDLASTDRSVTYACSEGCNSGAALSDCCPACTTAPTLATCAALNISTCRGTAGCVWTTSCVPGFDDPACYFASRLPSDTGHSGQEYNIFMGEWAMYIGGATSNPCSSGSANAAACTAIQGCYWSSINTCVLGYCTAVAATQLDCETGSTNTYPRPTSCGWDGTQSLCMPRFSTPPTPGCPLLTTPLTCVQGVVPDAPCSWSGGTQSACGALLKAALADSTICTKGPDGIAGTGDDCSWYDSGATCTGLNRYDCRAGNTICATYGVGTCATNGCNWTGTVCVPKLRCNTQTTSATCGTPTCSGTAATCANTAGCYWTGSACARGCAWYDPTSCGTTNRHCTDLPSSVTGGGTCSGIAFVQGATTDVLCSAATSGECTALGGNWCEWDSGGFCRPPLKFGFRADAAKTAVLITDEEDCYVKDGAGSLGGCSDTYGVTNTRPYTDAIRTARTSSYAQFYKSRNFLTFGITGDKADESLPISTTNGGCYLTPPTTNYRVAGNTVINTAEATGGGWGSICSADLYPTIEAIVISSLAKASPYKLEGFINGKAVQPIASTIKVSTEVCTVPAEYPTCASGSEMVEPPRSRENGFDYDPTYNTLVLYGSARPKNGADIVVSYRYWIDNAQPPQGNPACPCPETTPGGGCACPVGERCGASGTGLGTDLCVGATVAGKCTPKITAPTCAAVPGCVWSAGTSTCIGGVLGNQGVCDNSPGCSWVTADGGKCLVNGLCEPDPTCGGSCPSGQVCNPTLGLCVCDVTCAGSCGVGQQCDNNLVPHACFGLDAATCAVTSGCAYNAARAACYSTTCGQCLCDQTCGGGCPAGQLCDSNLTHVATCGSCYCDTTCGGGCTGGQSCDNNPASASCGRCYSTGCATCLTGYKCNPSTNTCVCDTTCGGNCPAGSTCDTNTSGGTCGQCLCDTTCGGTCPTGTVCQNAPLLANCGLCIADPTCGGVSCNPTCTGQTQGACPGVSGCRWAAWLNAGAGECVPIACKGCNSATGVCAVDPNCCGNCSPGTERCNSTTGACECDTTCKGSCPVGTTCDATPGATCGTCICDVTCGGTCPGGQVCGLLACGLCSPDPTCGKPGGVCNANCTAANEGACTALGVQCRWAPWQNAGAGACVPAQCQTCNSLAGVCAADATCCGACGPTESCNPATGGCQCDTTCGGACAPGLSCVSNTSSPNCGLCLCDTTCGGGCKDGFGIPIPGQVCDNNASCNYATAGTCGAAAGCTWTQLTPTTGICLSATCGTCKVDPTCGGCLAGELCNPVTGLCEAQCPICSGGKVCDPLTATCICDQTCGGGCALGKQCDDVLASPTCGTCKCDTTCGGACPAGTLCDINTGGSTCGMCIVDPTCGGPCPPNYVCDPTTGLCISDPNCGGCPAGYVCDVVLGRCVICGEGCTAP